MRRNHSVYIDDSSWADLQNLAESERRSIGSCLEVLIEERARRDTHRIRTADVVAQLFERASVGLEYEEKAIYRLSGCPTIRKWREVIAQLRIDPDWTVREGKYYTRLK